MKTNYCLFALFICFALHSCVVLSPKKYKALVAERDSLATRS
ncbi:MAG: chemotaxis protein MotB, partial [Mucilaginibacter sp.]|nr:chemotaxis protein MotB [Mucilaginibacter sp.]